MIIKTVKMITNIVMIFNIVKLRINIVDNLIINISGLERAVEEADLVYRRARYLGCCFGLCRDSALQGLFTTEK